MQLNYRGGGGAGCLMKRARRSRWAVHRWPDEDVGLGKRIITARLVASGEKGCACVAGREKRKESHRVAVRKGQTVSAE